MKKHWTGIALVTVALAGAGAFFAYGRSPDTTTQVTPVRNFEYSVTSRGCGATVEGADPKGHFCVLAVTVRNLSATSRQPGIAFARAHDSRGAEHLPDALAQIRSGSVLLTDLAPGARVVDRLYYDVPGPRTLTSVVLRETASSEPITVPLT
jgi:hypothetical protein